MIQCGGFSQGGLAVCLAHDTGRSLVRTHAPAGLKIIFGHPVSQGVAGHFEKPTGFRDVARGLLQRFLDYLFFHLLKRQPKG